MIDSLLDFIFPGVCVICGKLNKNYLCNCCYLNLKQELAYKTITKNQLNNKFKLYYMASYKGLVRKLILKFKFSDEAYISNAFSYLLIKNKTFRENITKYNYVIPVPSFKKNLQHRGYNQTELIAKQIEKKINIKCLTNVLIKTKENRRQSELNKYERILNVQNVYELRNEEIIKGKSILLIDDIYTTGNTIKECRKTLLKGKTKNIDCLCIAKR